MYSYVLVAPNDPDGEEWCAMDGALSHLIQVEAYARLDSKAYGSLHSRLVEAEMSIRHEWHRVAQQDRGISLDDAIELSTGYTHSPYYYLQFPKISIFAFVLTSVSIGNTMWMLRVHNWYPSALKSCTAPGEIPCVYLSLRDDFQKRSLALEERI